jgi:magnesium-transporting ATPase (P-type)
MRVLAAARRPADDGTDGLRLADLDTGLVLVGLVGILDPPRPSAVDAIDVCRRAGIRVKMITGDHADTARAIATEMGIGDGTGVISGPQLESATDEELAELVASHDVFARTSPEHKLRIVTALQACGEVAAMTGDGVNDAPALKRADVGVAMGIKGSDAAKEAADIVLADDNFETIERAVEEGRTIYDNLRKAILFILPTNGAQAMVMLVAVVFGLDLPLTPVQILWVNMVTSVTLALAFAFEPTEPGVMSRPPRRPGSSIIDAVFVRRLVLVSVLLGGATIAMFLASEASGRSVEFSRTLALNTLVIAQVFYLFSTRRLHASSWSPRAALSGRAVWVAIGVLTLLQLTFVYAPFMHVLFESEPLPLVDWVVPMLIGAGSFVVIELDKALLRRSTGTPD